MKIRPVGALLFHAKTKRQRYGRNEGRTDGQTDMTRLIVAFRNFVNRVNIYSVNTDIFSVVSSMLRVSQTFMAGNGLRCAWPTPSCTTASVSVSLTYTKRCGKPDGWPFVLLLLQRCFLMPLVCQM
jgi:hypothetical protein